MAKRKTTASDIEGMTYEQKEARLEEILVRLDNSETPMDGLADEAREAAALIMSMHATLRGTRQEIATVFEELDRHKLDQNEGEPADREPSAG